MNNIGKTFCALTTIGALCTAAALVFMSNYADKNTTTHEFNHGDTVFLKDGSYEGKSAVVKEGYGGYSHNYKGVYHVMVDADGDGEPDTLLLTKGAYMTKISAAAPAP